MLGRNSELKGVLAQRSREWKQVNRQELQLDWVEIAGLAHQDYSQSTPASSVSHRRLFHLPHLPPLVEISESSFGNTIETSELSHRCDVRAHALSFWLSNSQFRVQMELTV